MYLLDIKTWKFTDGWHSVGVCALNDGLFKDIFSLKVISSDTNMPKYNTFDNKGVLRQKFVTISSHIHNVKYTLSFEMFGDFETECILSHRTRYFLNTYLVMNAIALFITTQLNNT